MASDETSPSQIRVMTALVILGTFLAGAALGAGLLYWLSPGRPQPPPPPIFHMLGELNLSADQQSQSQKISERYQPKLQAIMRETFPKMRAVHAQMEEELRALLSADQRQKLDALKARRPPHDGHGPPGMGFPRPGDPRDPFDPHGPHGPPGSPGFGPPGFGPPGPPPGPPPPPFAPPPENRN
jgi:hypothetical protein